MTERELDRTMHLPEELSESPEPERARALAEGVMAALGDERVRALGHAERERLGDALFVLCGIAPFFAPFLQRHPEWLERLLGEDLDRTQEAGDLARRLQAHLAVEAETGAETVAVRGDREAALRRFKYYELARITLRDGARAGLPLARSGETLTLLSELADVLLAASLDAALEHVQQRHGPPRWRVAVPSTQSPRGSHQLSLHGGRQNVGLLHRSHCQFEDPPLGYGKRKVLDFVGCHPSN